MSDHHTTDESFEELYEHAPCGHFSSLANGVIVRANATFLHMGGYRLDDVIGRPFEQLLDPGSRVYLHTQFQQALALDGAVSEISLSLRHADGSTVSVVVNATMQRAADGTPGVVHTAVFDASKRQNYARELLEARRSADRAEQRVGVLEGASSILGTADSEDALVDAVGDIVRHAFDAIGARLMMVTGDTITATDGGDGTHVIARDALWPESAAQNDVAVMTTAELVEREPEFGLALSAQRIHSVVVCPVDDGGAVIAVIVSFFRRHREFDSNERDLLKALARYSGQVLKRIQLQEELRSAALHDQLTGLANRTLLAEVLEQALSASVRYARPMALLYLDLDGFKQINDTLGHTHGDAVLVEAADRLRRVIRRSDTIARVGGDEFVIVCSDTGPADLNEVVRRIHMAFAAPFELLVTNSHLTTSIGTALFEPGVHEPSGDALIRAADAAMYESKRAGTNRVTVVAVGHTAKTRRD